MAAIVVSKQAGIRVDSGIGATTVRLYTLPEWAHTVMVIAPLTTGSILEAAWSGTDGGASSTSDEWVHVPAGGQVTLPVPSSMRSGGASLYVRPQTTDATRICIVCSARGE